MLNAVYPSNVIEMQPAQNDAQIWQQFWITLFTKRPDIKRRFQNMKVGALLNILYNSGLSPAQKFEKIFGLKVDDLTAAVSKTLSGNFWDDLNNFFSNENLRKIETGIRQGQQISNNFANAINALRNQSSTQNAEELTTSKDLQSQFYFGADSFYQKYGPLMIVGGALLLGILILKK